MVDYTELTKDFKRNKNVQGQQLYAPDAICIFYVNANDDLVPIAIQLVPGDPETIFTPNDTELDWLLAKMYFKTTFGVMHEVSYLRFIVKQTQIIIQNICNHARHKRRAQLLQDNGDAVCCRIQRYTRKNPQAMP